VIELDSSLRRRRSTDIQKSWRADPYSYHDWSSPQANQAQRWINVILLTGVDSHSTASYRYDAFGKTLQATGPAAAMNRYRFSTKPIESGSGLAFYGYRYLSPELGRWLSRDPIAEKGGLHLYQFVKNNSGTELDRLGLDLWTWVGRIVDGKSLLDMLGGSDSATCGVGDSGKTHEAEVSETCSTKRSVAWTVIDMAEGYRLGEAVFDLNPSAIPDAFLGTEYTEEWFSGKRRAKRKYRCVIPCDSNGKITGSGTYVPEGDSYDLGPCECSYGGFEGSTPWNALYGRFG
jgi:RHS repeat-associated protein